MLKRTLFDVVGNQLVRDYDRLSSSESCESEGENAKQCLINEIIRSLKKLYRHFQ